MIVQPGNDAFVSIVEGAAGLLGYADQEVKAIAVVRGGKPAPYIRRVTYNRRHGRFDGLKVGDQVAVTDGNFAKAIADLVGPGVHHDLIVADENLGENAHRWVLWNPITERPELIGGKEIEAHYNAVL